MRIKLIDSNEASDRARQVFKEIEEIRGEGKVSVPFRALANVPEYLRAHWEYTKANKREGSRVTNKTKEMISVVVSVALGCKVWVTFHGNALRGEGIKDEEIKKIVRLDKGFLSLEELTILQFARKVAKEAYRITDMEINQIRQLGMTDQDLVDIIGTIVLATANAIIIDSLDLPRSPWVPELILEEMSS
jgi:uncharacterized peroxidase-related enzyme